MEHFVNAKTQGCEGAIYTQSHVQAQSINIGAPSFLWASIFPYNFGKTCKVILPMTFITILFEAFFLTILYLIDQKLKKFGFFFVFGNSNFNVMNVLLNFRN
jgi:hypothetical protein